MNNSINRSAPPQDIFPVFLVFICRLVYTDRVLNVRILFPGFRDRSHFGKGFEMYDLAHLLAFFMFYAFIGWCLEVIYHAVTTGHFINRGFFNGPICPIYGIGSVIVIVALTPIQKNIVVLYIGSVLLTSLLELVTGFILDKIYHQRWWDYTEDPFNFKGYICLHFSLLWGLGCVVLIKIVQPVLLLIIDKTPKGLQTTFFIIFYVLLAADMAITLTELIKIQSRLRLANDMDHLLNGIAEVIGTRITSGTLKGMKEYEEQKERFEGMKKWSSEHLNSIEDRYNGLVEKAKAKYGDKFDLSERLSFVHRRLEKAYPNLDLGRIKNISMTEKFKSLRSKIEELKNSDSSAEK